MSEISRRDFLRVGAVAAGVGVLSLFSPAKASAGQEQGAFPESFPISEGIKTYLSDTEGNIDPKSGIIRPSRLYEPHLRDAFFACVGLGRRDLSSRNFAFFSETADFKTGQVPTCRSLENDELVFRDDESTLLFILWAGILKRQGITVDLEIAKKALDYVNLWVDSGEYYSPIGNYAYWADTVCFDQPEVVTYNQGFYAVALRMCQEMGLGINERQVELAQQGYLRSFDKKLGFVTLGKNSRFAKCQDVSALLPEFFNRYIFGTKIMTDEAVWRTFNHHYKSSAVYSDDGWLLGIKIIAGQDGEFLDPKMFSPDSLNTKGCYQNGGYWPMFTQMELSLINKISPNKFYAEVARRLLEIEMTNNQHSQEYLILAPWGKGSCDPSRSGYSWNALAATGFRYSNIYY